MAAGENVVRIDGLRELQAKLKAVDGQLQKQLRLVLNDAVQIVVDDAKGSVPKRTGKAANSLKAQSQQRKAVIKAGGARVPYYPWLDFGGAVGRNNSVNRDFIKSGRYIYPSIGRNRDEVIDKMAEGVYRLMKKAGLV